MTLHDASPSLQLVARSSGIDPEIAVRGAGVSRRWAAARWRRRVAQLERPERLHDHLLSYCLRGGGRSSIGVDGRWLHCQHAAGGLMLLPAGSAVQWTMEAPSEALHLHLYIPADALPAGGLAPTADLHDPWLDGFFRLLRAELDAPSASPLGEDASNALLEAAAPLLLQHLSASLCATGSSDHLHRVSALRPTLLRRVEQHVDDRLAEDIPLATLAALAGLSVDHFVRSFHEAVGQTPHQWVLERRLDRAQALLREATLPIAEVARRCGFASASHFSTTFRHRFGRTPSDFRRRC